MKFVQFCSFGKVKWNPEYFYSRRVPKECARNKADHIKIHFYRFCNKYLEIKKDNLNFTIVSVSQSS